MGVWRQFGRRLETVQELTKYFWRRRLWWLLPMVVLLGLFGVLLVTSQTMPFVAPFIYTMF